MKSIKYSLIFLLLFRFTLITYPQFVPKDLTSEESKKAFDDLKEYYEKGIIPPYEIALKNMTSSDESIKLKSEEYIFSLFSQSLADERNGRSEWKKMPFFYEAWDSKAQNFRKQLAKHFGDKANRIESINIAEWLIDSDYIEENKLEGLKVITRNISHVTDKILDRLISIPHLNESVIIKALEEIANRKLFYLSPIIDSLQNHYRKKIRTTSNLCAVKLHFTPKEYDPSKAITPWVEQQLEKVYHLIYDKVSVNAPFVTIKTERPSRVSDRKWISEYAGWIIREDSSFYFLLDCSAQNLIIEKKHAQIKYTSLAEESKRVINNEGIYNFEGSHNFDSRIFEIRVHQNYQQIPHFTMAAWCYKNNLRKEALSILAQIIDNTPDDSAFSRHVVNSFGNLYYNELLYAFSQERNYSKAIRLAEHISTQEFSGFPYQKTARELGLQLKSRNSDFITFTLPKPKVWDSLKVSLTRSSQIEYLLEHLRLLNCVQLGQPDGIRYSSKQYDIPYANINKPSPQMSNFPFLNLENDGVQKSEVINPYEELLKMQLNLKEIKMLVPYLADENFILGYNFWRDFNNRRTLHKVSWVVAKIIKNTTGREFVDMIEFKALDKNTQQQKINEIIKWCDENKSKTEEELLLDILQSTSKWTEFEYAMNTSLKNKYSKALPILISRLDYFDDIDLPIHMHEFPTKKGEIAKSVFLLGTNKSVDLNVVRKWQAKNDNWVKFWSSLFLIRSSDSTHIEGLRGLKDVLEKCDGTEWYPYSIETLINSHNKDAFELAEGILKKEEFNRKFYWEYYNEFIKRLFLARSEKAFLFLKNGIENTEEDSEMSSINSGTFLKCDNFITVLNNWRNPDIKEVSLQLLSINEHKALSRKLDKWLQVQFKLVKEGKQCEIQLNSTVISEPISLIDSPLW